VLLGLLGDGISDEVGMMYDVVVLFACWYWWYYDYETSSCSVLLKLPKLFVGEVAWLSKLRISRA
jgi:hypothetical protein